MTYTGFCEKQNKMYSVSFAQIDASATDDASPVFINGRLECLYAGLTGCCTHPNQCSILKEYMK